MDSRTKDKIYAFLSLLVIVSVIGSFAFVAEFLLEINKYIFSVNQDAVKEKTTTVDKAGFEKIIGRLQSKGVRGAEMFQAVKEPAADKVISPVIDVLWPDLSPGPSASPLPVPSPKTKNGKARIPAGVDIPVPSPIK